MDEFEKKRKHRGSQSSVESMNSIPSPIMGKQEHSKNFGVLQQGEEKFTQKVVGRLRALTGGKDRDEGKHVP